MSSGASTQLSKKIYESKKVVSVENRISSRFDANLDQSHYFALGGREDGKRNIAVIATVS